MKRLSFVLAGLLVLGASLGVAQYFTGAAPGAAAVQTNRFDQYGYYNSTYDWSTADPSYSDWYGRSDNIYQTPSDVYGYYGQRPMASDGYGAYRPDLAWDVDVDWWNSWYGDSDEMFRGGR